MLVETQIDGCQILSFAKNYHFEVIFFKVSIIPVLKFFSTETPVLKNDTDIGCSR
jgi:hypothetical protein